MLEHYCATMTLDHTTAIMIYVMWHEEHIRNLCVLHSTLFWSFNCTGNDKTCPAIAWCNTDYGILYKNTSVKEAYVLKVLKANKWINLNLNL
jgi:hypothetical protein